MTIKSILWISLATLALATCASPITRPDARQAATASATAAAAPAATAPVPPAERETESRGRATVAGGEAPGTPAAPVRGGRGPGGPPNNLEGAMGEMNRMLTAIKREAADPANMAQTLKDLATFERDVAIAKTLTPNVNRIPAEKRAETLEDYRIMMSSVSRTLLDLEDAVSDKKPDAIKKLIAQLDELETQGHKELNVRPEND